MTRAFARGTLIRGWRERQWTTARGRAQQRASLPHRLPRHDDEVAELHRRERLTLRAQRLFLGQAQPLDRDPQLIPPPRARIVRRGVTVLALGRQHRVDGEGRRLRDQLQTLALVGKPRGNRGERTRDTLRPVTVIDQGVDRGHLDPADKRTRGEHADALGAQRLQGQQVAAGWSRRDPRAPVSSPRPPSPAGRLGDHEAARTNVRYPGGGGQLAWREPPTSMIDQQPAKAHVRASGEVAHGHRGRQQDGSQPQRDRRRRMQQVDHPERERSATDDQQPLTPRQTQIRDGSVDVLVGTVTHRWPPLRRVREDAGG